MTYFDKLFLRGYSLLTIVNLKNYLIVPFAFPHVHAKLLHYRLNRFLEFDLKVLSNPPFEIKAITEARSEIFYIIYTDLMLLACTLDTTINTQIDFDKVIVEQLSTCSFDIDGETINLLQNRWWIEFGADMISARAYTIPTMGL